MGPAKKPPDGLSRDMLLYRSSAADLQTHKWALLRCVLEMQVRGQNVCLR